MKLNLNFFFSGDNPRLWEPEHGGYALHLISTFSEWFLVFSYSVYVSTFYWEFRNVNVKLPPVKVKCFFFFFLSSVMWNGIP